MNKTPLVPNLSPGGTFNNNSKGWEMRGQENSGSGAAIDLIADRQQIQKTRSI